MATVELNSAGPCVVGCWTLNALRSSSLIRLYRQISSVGDGRRSAHGERSVATESAVLSFEEIAPTAGLTGVAMLAIFCGLLSANLSHNSWASSVEDVFGFVEKGSD